MIAMLICGRTVSSKLECSSSDNHSVMRNRSIGKVACARANLFTAQSEGANLRPIRVADNHFAGFVKLASANGF